jgi:hypothetical protein
MNGRSDDTINMVHEEENPTPSSTVSFLHAIGQSSVRQGISVPVCAQVGWLAEIRKGQSVPVMISYDQGEMVPAILRRINNARGHLQFRYESRKQAALRDYLTAVFGDKTVYENCLLRVSEAQPHVFLFEPVSIGRQAVAALSLFNPYFHNCECHEIRDCLEYRELERCLTAIPYNEEHNQAQYNKQIGVALNRMGWKCETRILDQIGLRCDYEKNGVWVEVEFGNARVYYQDYIKFLLASRHRAARLGILLCPTNAFAELLCDLGQRRALIKRSSQAKGQPYYSGMMSYEKAMRELPYLRFMLTSSLVIAGIEVNRGESDTTGRGALKEGRV